MTVEQRERLFELVEQVRKGDEAATAALGSLNRVERPCDSCGGVVVTITLGGTDRPQIRFRLGSMGRRHMQLNDDGDCKPAHTYPRRDITIKCGGCGASLIRFEGGSCD